MSAVTLMLVTDPRYGAKRIVEVARAASVVPGFCVHLRDRSDTTDDALEPLARELRAITRAAGATFVVNRRFDLARRVSADGVHAPATELEAARDFAWRSAPVHTGEDLDVARAADATAVLVSPIFDTPGKSAARGVSVLRAAKMRASGMTLVALGGVTVENAAQCREAGADAVAVIRALFDAPDPAEAAKRLAPHPFESSDE